MVTVNELLAHLAPFQNRWKLINRHQDVNDIIRQILRAHDNNAAFYDKIALYFDADTPEGIAQNINDFLKKNIRYVEEPRDEQTTALPTGILTRRQGDCKHYASFTGGILDALNRKGRKINWVYRFASYKVLRKAPYHVFVVIHDGDNELWIDPVPGAETQTPIWIWDKKISANMALYDNIAGFNDSIGWAIEQSAGYTSSGAIAPKVGNSFYGSDYLGLTRYGNPSGADLNQLRAQLQAIIDESPYPKYQLDAGLLYKVITENIQNWNFFYPNGTSPTPRPWKQQPALYNWLMLTITPDGRLTFDRDQEPPHTDAQIHWLVDWVNYLVQAYSDEPYIPTMEHVKRLGKGWKTPQEGSLWHVIHTGDVNFAKVNDWLDKIPGLRALMDKWGLNLDVLTSSAKEFLQSGININDPGIPVPGNGTNQPIPGQPTPSTMKLPMLLMGGILLGALLLKPPAKRRVSGIKTDDLAIIGLGALLLLSMKKGKDRETVPETVTEQPTTDETKPIDIIKTEKIIDPAVFDRPVTMFPEVSIFSSI